MSKDSDAAGKAGRFCDKKITKESCVCQSIKG
jgi:hypothetical protein